MPSPSIFHQSRPLSSSTLAQSTLSVLHDHDKLMRCQPLVGQIEDLKSAPDRAQPDERSTEFRWFRQTEYVPFLPFGLWKKKVIFENYYKDIPDTPVTSTTSPAVTATDATTITSVEGQIPALTATSTTAAASVATANLLEGGVESKVYAPGLQIKATFKVVKRRADPRKDTLKRRDRDERADVVESGWSIVEDTVMTCDNFIIKWLSVGQHRAAQRKMVDNILFEAKKRVYGAAAVEAEVGKEGTGTEQQ